jgi:hypothetical protein
MSVFSGGSAWAMAKDIAEGFLLVNERTFQRLDAGQHEQLAFELDRALREARGIQVDAADLEAVKTKNRRISRLTGALTLLRSSQKRRFRRGDRPTFDGNL